MQLDALKNYGAINYEDLCFNLTIILSVISHQLDRTETRGMILDIEDVIDVGIEYSKISVNDKLQQHGSIVQIFMNIVQTHTWMRLR